MALFSLPENNGCKENIPISSSEQPAVSNPASVRLDKKRRLRIPLEDITNLLYPGCPPSVQQTPSSHILLAGLINQAKNRRKRIGTRFLFLIAPTGILLLAKDSAVYSGFMKMY
ncbi:hypothetical protein OROHE_001604 [Orobanche hederae]